MSGVAPDPLHRIKSQTLTGRGANGMEYQRNVLALVEIARAARDELAHWHADAMPETRAALARLDKDIT